MIPLTITPIPPEPDADWRDDALCATTDPNKFVLDKGESSLPAKRICAACPVTEQCLQYAVTNYEKGIWAGTTDDDRAAMRRAG